MSVKLTFKVTDPKNQTGVVLVNDQETDLKFKIPKPDKEWKLKAAKAIEEEIDRKIIEEIRKQSND